VSEPRRDFAAKYPGTCGTCEGRFAVGDPIASTMVAAKRVFHHSACVYGGDPPDASRPAAPAFAPGACQATTKSGQPCRGGVKKGEIYCGPHLDQVARAGTATHSSATRAPAADPVPGRPTAQDREGWDPF